MARRLSFWEVWWIPSPILDARLLNSERADVAAINPSRVPVELLLAAAGADDEEGAAWRRALSTAARNSLVRSRNDACAGRVGIMSAPRRWICTRIWISRSRSPSLSLSDSWVGGVGEENEGDERRLGIRIQ